MSLDAQVRVNNLADLLDHLDAPKAISMLQTTHAVDDCAILS